jgi:hypothetical protein
MELHGAIYTLDRTHTNSLAPPYPPPYHRITTATWREVGESAG